MQTITFRNSWVDSRHFETALSGNYLHESGDSQVSFVFPVDCKIMVDAGIRLLSLANQLCMATKRVVLVFEGEDSETMGYLNRIGFFDHLKTDIEVTPYRPEYSAAEQFRGQNQGIVEIASISPGSIDNNLPSKLSNALQAAVSDPKTAKRVGDAAFGVFAELIQNIPYHAETPIDGYAALQKFPQSSKIKVAVSDSGKGILNTLRPSLTTWHPRLVTFSDTDLVVEAFRNGISRLGGARGLGLKASANHALKYNAELDVRLPNCRVHLEPSKDGYRPHLARCMDGLPLLWGTHICFDFMLDK